MTLPPVLTIAIPTWNRGSYLAQNLAQLHAELREVPPGRVEVLVSDNHSTDDDNNEPPYFDNIGAAGRYPRIRHRGQQHGYDH